jgi:predicted nucleotidyltransferase
LTDLKALVATLCDAGVEFIVIGGAAATAHGSARLTNDIDVVYARSADNLRRIVGAIAPHCPYPRGAPPGLPFLWDETTLRNGLNFTLTTALGDLDLLGEVAGGGGYKDLLPHTVHLIVFGRDLLCVNLTKLIELKRAAGRPKDFEAIAELELLLAERSGTS